MPTRPVRPHRCTARRTSGGFPGARRGSGRGRRPDRACRKRERAARGRDSSAPSDSSRRSHSARASSRAGAAAPRRCGRRCAAHGAARPWPRRTRRRRIREYSPRAWRIRRPRWTRGARLRPCSTRQRPRARAAAHAVCGRGRYGCSARTGCRRPSRWGRESPHGRAAYGSRRADSRWRRRRSRCSAPSGPAGGWFAPAQRSTSCQSKMGLGKAGSAGQNFKFQHAVRTGHLRDHLLEPLMHLARLGGDRHARAAVGGDGLVDGQDVGTGAGEDGQAAREHARIVAQEGITRYDVPGLHVLKRLDGVLIFIERAAADADLAGGLADGGGLADLQHPLGLGHLQKHLRQRVCGNDVIFLLCHGNPFRERRVRPLRMHICLCYCSTPSPGVQAPSKKRGWF